MNTEEKKQRGGARPGAGRKSAYGNVDTAQYKLPISCAAACQEYARVMLSNGGEPPMACSDGHARIRMQLPRGHQQILAMIIDDWKTQGIANVPELISVHVSPEADNVTLQYTDTCNLVEIVLQYARKVSSE